MACNGNPGTLEIAAQELRSRLQQDGVVLLRNFFAGEPLTRLRGAAGRCFEAIEEGKPIPERYGFSPQSHSVRLAALLDFGIENEPALLAPLLTAGLSEIFSCLVGEPWRCRLEHSWVRKKFAPQNAPKAGYHIQDWHQDGALGVRFPLQPGSPVPAANLATCWIPLDDCGRESPGLEFVRHPQPVLLHFTELNDAALRQRFGRAAFWAPALEFGDGLVFRNLVLHRTHVDEDMRADRISVEYRIFPEEP